MDESGKEEKVFHIYKKNVCSRSLILFFSCFLSLPFHSKSMDKCKNVILKKELLVIMGWATLYFYQISSKTGNSEVLCKPRGWVGMAVSWLCLCPVEQLCNTSYLRQVASSWTHWFSQREGPARQALLAVPGPLVSPMQGGRLLVSRQAQSQFLPGAAAGFSGLRAAALLGLTDEPRLAAVAWHACRYSEYIFG